MSDSAIVSSDQVLSNNLRIITLSQRPIFPGIFTPLIINSEEDIKVIEAASKDDSLIGIVLLKNDIENPTGDDLYQVGTVARIIKKMNLPDGGLNVFISTIKRFSIKRILSNSNPIVAAVEYLEDEEDDTFQVKALTRTLISEMKEISDNNPLFSEEMRLNMVNIDHPGKIADFIASILNVEKADQQRCFVRYFDLFLLIEFFLSHQLLHRYFKRIGYCYKSFKWRLCGISTPLTYRSRSYTQLF